MRMLPLRPLAAALLFAGSACSEAPPPVAAAEPAAPAAVTAASTAVEHVHPVPVAQAYLRLQECLVQSDAACATAAAAVLTSAVAEGEEWSSSLADFPAGLEAQRQRFAAVTTVFLAQREARPEVADGTVVAFCPMAFQGRGGTWVQAPGMLRNPYYGDAMLSCGRFVSDP